MDQVYKRSGHILGILLRHFLDSDADLSVTITGRVDGPIRATTKQHTLTFLIQLVLILTTSTSSSSSSSSKFTQHVKSTVLQKQRTVLWPFNPGCG